MLLTSAAIGWPQNQLSVTLNFHNEKSTLQHSLSSKFFDHLFYLFKNRNQTASILTRKQNKNMIHTTT